MTHAAEDKQKDWVGSTRAFTLAWGLPIAAFVAATFVGPSVKTVIWTAALIWMGAACLANARRCGRTHCYFTGPFFLLMTIPVLLHGFGIVSLGPTGWRWLGMTVGVGGGGLWFLSELIWGRYLTDRKAR